MFSVQPEDLFLLTAGSDELKVIDFGLSQRFKPNRKAYAMYGNAEFMSPEAASGEAVTTQSDMWSVGIIAYIMSVYYGPHHIWFHWVYKDQWNQTSLS